MSSTLTERFDDASPTFGRLAAFLKADLEALLVDMPVSHIDIRVKDKASFLTKAADPDKNYLDPLIDITDLAGVRVVLDSRLALDDVEQLIRQRYAVADEHSEKKSSRLSNTEFGYLSDHYVGKLASSAVLSSDDLTAFPKIAESWFEIQVRTVLQDAWAKINHSLQYKAKDAPTDDLQRRLSIMAALFELSDRELDHIRGQSQLPIAEGAVPASLLDAPITAESLTEYLLSAPEVEEWAEVTRAQGVVMGDRIGMVGRDVDMALRIGLQTIRDIADILIAARPWGVEFIEAYYERFIEHYTRTNGAPPMGLTTDRNGIVTYFLVAWRPDTLNESTLESDYCFGGAWNLLEAAYDANPALQRPKADVIEYLGVVYSRESRDILGHDDGQGRLHKFKASFDSLDIEIQLTMSGTAGAILTNQGVDPDEWLKDHAAAVIQRHLRDARNSTEARSVMLDSADVATLSRG